MLETSPPSEAISLTVLEERKVCSSAVIKRNRFDIAGKALVCQSHAELELKIGEHAQAAYDHLCIDLAGKFHGQAAIAGHFDLGVAVECLPDQFHAFFGGEHQ